MPAVIDICNLALADLGDSANVSSIEPPDSSSQAAYCARFYPIARDMMLELHDWNFSSRRSLLSLRGGPVGTADETDASCAQWPYTYASPGGMICARAVIDADSPDDMSVSFPLPYSPDAPFSSGGQGVYTPQRFIVETLDTGELVIRTFQSNAMLRYTAKITDPTKFSPLFVVTCSKILAAFLAGPVIHGQEGVQVGRAKLQEALAMLPKATSSDANQRRADIVQSVAWMVGR